MRATLSAAAVLAALGAALPARAGGFPIGVTALDFTKSSVTTGAERTLSTLVWYPARRGTGTEETLGWRDAAVARGRHPLILFSHGNCGRPREATYLTRALAAAGFVVAAPGHRGNTADDPACLAAFADSFANRVPDVRFVLDGMLAQAGDRSSRFWRRIRPRRPGISGLSFGGYTTLAAAQQEARFAAAFALVPGGAAALDPAGIAIPALVIGSERDTIVPFSESEAAWGLLRGPRFLVQLLGGNHLSAVDDCYNHDLEVDLCVPGDIAQEDAHRLILRYAVTFFQRHLRGQRAAGRTLGRTVPGVTVLAEPRPGSS